MAHLRWGIIGCGDVCEKKSGPALYKAEGSALVAVMRRDAAKAQDFAARHGAQRSYGSVDELLADADVNAVYVASPPNVHLEHVLAALNAGKKTIMVEKPMGLTEGECSRMMDACKASGAHLYIAYYRRFYAKWQVARKLLNEGAIGTVVGARLQMCNSASTSGWRVDPAVSGGGHFVDVGSHRMDMLMYLLGDVEDVAGFASNRLGLHTAENDVAFALRLTSGVVCSGSFHYGTKPARDVLEIYGSTGTMVFDPFDGPDFRVLPSDPSAQPVNYSFPTPSPVHLPFVQALVWHASGTQPSGPVADTIHDARLLATHVPGEEGVKATRVMDAVLASFRATAADSTRKAAAAPGT